LERYLVDWPKRQCVESAKIEQNLVHSINISLMEMYLVGVHGDGIWLVNREPKGYKINADPSTETL